MNKKIYKKGLDLPSLLFVDYRTIGITCVMDIESVEVSQKGSYLVAMEL